MANYRKLETDFAEGLSVHILRYLGLEAQRNNLEHISNVDIIINNKIKMDVQYSQNFALYGDLRLDFVSAYSQGEKGRSFSKINLFQRFEEIYGFKVDKVGKYFQEDYLDAVIVLFYNYKFQQEFPNQIMIIRKDEILQYLNQNMEQCLKKLKLNIKNGLGDIHGSAFLPINVESLKSNIQCFCDTIDNLKKLQKEIQAYLNK